MDGSYFLLPVLLLTFLASLFTMECVIVIWLVNSDRSLKKLIHNGKLVKILYWLKFEKLYPKKNESNDNKAKIFGKWIDSVYKFKTLSPFFFFVKKLFSLATMKFQISLYSLKVWKSILHLQISSFFLSVVAYFM